MQLIQLPQKKRKTKKSVLTRQKYMDPTVLNDFRAFMATRGTGRQAETDRLVVEILAGTGMRAGELVQAQENPGRYLRIGDCILGDEPAIHVVEGKGYKPRNIPITTGLRDTIIGYIKKWLPDSKPEDPLVQARNGQAMKYCWLNSVLFKRWVVEYEKGGRKTGLTKPSVHAMRHSTAMAFIAANGPDYKSLSAILGHSNSAVTMNVYCHLAEGKLRECVNRMG